MNLRVDKMANEDQTQALLVDRLKELEQSLGRNINVALEELEKNKGQIKNNLLLYYNEKKDMHDQNHYYHSIEKRNSSNHLFLIYHELIKRTHKQQLPYFMSKDQYLYTWVDLHPDGSIRSIYSGIQNNPIHFIEEDFDMIQKKYQTFQQLLHDHKYFKNLRHGKISKVDDELKFNTEHIVPLSWFSAKEPMKGDLHHLFACQPDCNIKRSNFPYADFSFYTPESPEEKIQNECGITSNNGFEPEHGKGTIARAMLYFLLRYPNIINKTFLNKIDYSLLLSWHQQFEVTLYEKHRNQAIYSIQGNRNPFIDFPELAQQLFFNK